MKREKKFTCCVRYYDIMSGTVSYRVFVNRTVREINKEIKDFISSNDNYRVKLFKIY
nr:MAG TPA: hypothetical protein [Microviridae sp.]